MKSKFGIFGIAGRAVLVVALAGLALACSRQKLSFDDLRQRYMDQATGGASRFRLSSAGTGSREPMPGMMMSLMVSG